ncbi:hypothetical protein BABINDRAFT_162540 [Babjeviella inositovora NRRL Y-12698]|uniref:Uncharacterized protein n=1 Tax=Babjeviella inositovora NRRL Y-12698 TaxID=984486 RepID=A0A1E3QPG2_9ASCO|nr:uncharacterized protein BABINDRAFT_162540 [Babjeviella inositovora NRRL Y-12698]ODQ78867.1 hypothetical protein BABINDRAFT_162540 [Babjeviella inositovora NRRL Y-12698]
MIFTDTPTNMIKLNDAPDPEKRLSRSICPSAKALYRRLLHIAKKYISFMGPGIMVAVAYIDPGNYSTATSAGSTNRFSLLFFVLLSNIIAIFLQCLCIKLGSVTGFDLSRACREHLPRKLNYTVYFFAEAAIIATDVAEVIGSAIALNILIKVPLPAGVVISCIDVLLVLLAYRPGSSLKFVKIFEIFVAALVLAVVICFCFELSRIPSSITVREVLRGYAPSKQMLENNGIYQATAILGATVMPHSLFLGSGLVQPRLRDFDIKEGYVQLSEDSYENEESYLSYRPSLAAIKYAYNYSVAELTITLFTFALFVNSAILVVSGATLYGTPQAADADLYGIHHLLSTQLAPIAGTIFMLALLFSGQSAGIVCTIAGQIVGEGHIKWTLKPWKRRLATRSITIIPCLAISVSIGKNGLNTALNVSQVVLSILLPFLVAPLIWFTSQKKYMRVMLSQPRYHDDVSLQTMEPETELLCRERRSSDRDQVEGPAESEKQQEGLEVENTVEEYKYFDNSWLVIVIAVMIWLFISALNILAIVQMAQNGI